MCAAADDRNVRSVDDAVPGEVACGVCAEMLVRASSTTDASYGGWRHVMDDESAPAHMRPDHTALPVLRDQVQAMLRCDLCYGQRPTWVLPTEPFRSAAEPSRVSGDVDWMLCDVCARLVKKNRWDAVIDRAVRSMAARHGVNAGDPRLTGHMKAHIGQLREFQTGPVHRLGAEQVRR